MDCACGIFEVPQKKGRGEIPGGYNHQVKASGHGGAGNTAAVKSVKKNIFESFRFWLTSA